MIFIIDPRAIVREEEVGKKRTQKKFEDEFKNTRLVDGLNTRLIDGFIVNVFDRF
jgi:hypothetical protein